MAACENLWRLAKCLPGLRWHASSNGFYCQLRFNDGKTSNSVVFTILELNLEKKPPVLNQHHQNRLIIANF